MTYRFLVALACAIALPSPALAQDDPQPQSGGMPMDHGKMDMPPADNHAMPAMNMPPAGDNAMPAMNMGSADHGAMPGMAMPGDEGHGDHAPAEPGQGSGTSRLPALDGEMHGAHLMAGKWMVMAHGYVTAQYTSDSGPRGDDKLYSTSMMMLTGERKTGWGRIQLKSMFSLEPTMSARGYPNLFATGETAGGVALVDRQHPHDLFMELAARIDVDLSPGTSLFLYGGPVGEPALGPSAFVHRASAQNNPEPPITHHWFDSTHITYGVVTAGVTNPLWQIEASAFRGAEPDEQRWDIETPRLDSWSIRATLNPSPRWALQASYGELHQPEALHPGEDEHRFTASAQYANGRGLSAMLAFSAKDRVPGRTLTAWLGEANWDLDEANSLFGRIENVANDELFPDHSDPLHDTPFRITKFQFGYARHFKLGEALMLTLGASGSAYAKPAALDPAYGDNPMGYSLFAKLSLGR